MQAEWNIKGRAETCSVTGRAFTDGETFWSALFWKDGTYERLDFCETAWKERNDNIAPLSAWRSKFEPPAVVHETLKKDDAESLLRQMMEENNPAHRNARYILALMLERKRLLRQIDRQQNGNDIVLIYEHLPTSETWLIADPQLKLQDLAPVQAEVAEILAGRMQVSELAAIPPVAEEPAVAEPR
jgi:hypothetical protein